MGLDMYLHKKTYVKNWSHMNKEELHEITVKKAGKVRKDIKPERISEITEEVAYWRKFNALHAWFVAKCQNGEDNCGEYYVSREQLKELLSLLEEVMKNKGKAKSLLPTRSGFFFGGTDYDEYYYNDVKETITVLKKLIKEEGGDFYYTSSW
jgi:hypothetical protein